MDTASLKQYLSTAYQGPQSFLENIIFPIFGEDAFEDGYETELLETQPELQTLAEASGINSVKQIGTIYVGDPLQIFDITVADRVLMQRNRVGIQQLIRRAMDVYSSSFMLFHYDDGKRWDWRFTFCQKLGSNNDATDSKRYTFLLGPGQSCRTAADNFVNLFNKRDSLMMSDIEHAFSVEALSNEFFDKYKKHYEDIIQFITGKRMVKVANKWEEREINEPCELIMHEFESFPDPEKSVRDYVKKLMGRLVFLQFLQKKGWLGVPVGEPWGTGDAEFIQHLFEQCTDKDHFIDDVLEVLFNDLNTERTNDLVSPAVGHDIRVPYLNGGLFEREATDETEFPLPAQYMQSLLDFFSSYNFTIDENDPDDAEVGVDPEMLGRIFENLLEDNKDKGAFYTPKEIVSYMCRESLIAYLQTDIEDEETKDAIRQFVLTHNVEALGTNDKFRQQVDKALKDVKICDPAIGSGAFPMGLLKELFLCRTALEGIEQSKAAEIKKHIIQQNIYGVDIERGAVDIARLRFWLSLIVDEETPQALPNLDFKIMQGNSLLEQYQGVDLSSMTEITTEKQGVVQLTWFDNQLDILRQHLREMLAQYYNCTNHDEKKQLRASIINNVKQQLNEQSIIVDFGDLDLSGNNQFLLWHTWFYDVFSQGGFDIVLGNPPYISAPTQIASPILAEQRQRIKDCEKYETLHEKWDLYIPFMEWSIKLLSPHGLFSMIVPYSLSNQKYAKKMRKLICSKKQLLEVVDANGVKVFENASVSNCIVIIRNSDVSAPVCISHIDRSMNIQVDYTKNVSEIVQDQDSYVWDLANERHNNFCYEGWHVLGDYCYISIGMVLNADETKAKGQFKKADLISSTKDNIHCMEYVEAKNIGRYVIKNVRFLEYGTLRCPGQLRRPTFPELYDRPKLLTNKIGSLKVVYDDRNILCDQTNRICIRWIDMKGIKNKSIAGSIKKYSTLKRGEMEALSKDIHLYYLLGILNSTYANHLLDNIRGVGNIDVNPEYIRNIPIPMATEEEQKGIINIVNKMAYGSFCRIKLRSRYSIAQIAG